MFWIIAALICLAVCFLVDWLLLVINTDRAPYQEPEGNLFLDTLSANPNRGRYQ